MRGTYSRGSKLSGVRLTLSKLNAKYSKTSAALDEDFSDEVETEDDVLKSSNSLLTFPASQPKAEGGIPDADAVMQTLQQTQEEVVHADSSVERNGQDSNGDSESQQRNSPLVEENSLLETASSIESVKTDSILGFNNVHSVSSLAESVLPLNEVEVKNIPTSIAMHGRRASPKPLMSNTSSENSCISSSRGRSSHVQIVSLVSSNVKLIQKPPTEHVPTPRLELSFSDREMPGNLKETRATNIIDNNALDKSITSSEESPTLEKRHVSEERVTHYRKRKSSIRNKSKTVGVQTAESGCRMIEPPIICCGLNTTQPAKSSQKVPIMKATKLPLFLKEASAISNDDELSQLISYHLHLTKEFLERQHRVYMANCKAVQFLEKGYQENTLGGICKCAHPASYNR